MMASGRQRRGRLPSPSTDQAAKSSTAKPAAIPLTRPTENRPLGRRKATRRIVIVIVIGGVIGGVIVDVVIGAAIVFSFVDIKRQFDRHCLTIYYP